VLQGRGFGGYSLDYTIEEVSLVSSRTWIFTSQLMTKADRDG
jgi:hypothetical protein